MYKIDTVYMKLTESLQAQFWHIVRENEVNWVLREKEINWVYQVDEVLDVNNWGGTEHVI